MRLHQEIEFVTPEALSNHTLSTCSTMAGDWGTWGPVPRPFIAENAPLNYNS
jgi:hypothetical protein